MAKDQVERRQAAREKARQIAQAQANREKRAKTILWSGIGVVVVAVIAVIVVLIVQSSRPAVGPVSMVNGGVTLTKGDDGAVAVAHPSDKENVPEGLPAYDTGKQKDDAAHVDVYMDFQCPACKNFEDANGASLAKLMESGDITVTYHPVSILDGASGGNKFSTRAANAFMCVADAKNDDKLVGVLQGIFAQQPEEGGNGMEDDQLLDILKKAEVDLDAKTTALEEQPSVRDCVTNTSFEKYVQQSTKVAQDKDLHGTPRIQVNGKDIEPKVWSNPQAFGRTLLEETGQIGGEKKN